MAFSLMQLPNHAYRIYNGAGSCHVRTAIRPMMCEPIVIDLRSYFVFDLASAALAAAFKACATAAHAINFTASLPMNAAICAMLVFLLLVTVALLPRVQRR